MQDQLNKAQQLFCVTVQKTVVSDAAKAFGQNMLQDKPYKVFTFEGAATDFSGTGLDVSEGDVAVLAGDDVAFTDDAPVQVPRQVFQSGQTFAGKSAVNHPFLGNRVGYAESGVGQCGKKASAGRFSA